MWSQYIRPQLWMRNTEEVDRFLSGLAHSVIRSFRHTLLVMFRDLTVQMNTKRRWFHAHFSKKFRLGGSGPALLARITCVISIMRACRSVLADALSVQMCLLTALSEISSENGPEIGHNLQQKSSPDCRTEIRSPICDSIFDLPLVCSGIPSDLPQHRH